MNDRGGAPEKYWCNCCNQPKLPDEDRERMNNIRRMIDEDASNPEIDVELEKLAEARPWFPGVGSLENHLRILRWKAAR